MYVVDARVKILQKALEKGKMIVDARQILTRQNDAREIIQQRRLHLSSIDAIHNRSSRGHFNSLDRVQTARRSILTVKSILNGRAPSRHSGFREERQLPVDQGRFDGVEKKQSSQTTNSQLNAIRSVIMKMSRSSPKSNTQSMRPVPDRPSRSIRVNDKPYNRPIAVGYEDSTGRKDTNRYFPTPAMRRIAGNAMFNYDGYQDDLLDRSSKNHGEKLRSRLGSRQITKRERSIGHIVIVSNLEPSVTCEDIREIFADIGDLLDTKVIQPGVAEVIYNHRADAIQAVDVYHNRQLDGKPMKCDMVRNAVSKTVPISVSGTSCRMSKWC